LESGSLRCFLNYSSGGLSVNCKRASFGFGISLGVPGGWRNGRCPVRFGISYHRCEEFFKVGFGLAGIIFIGALGLLLDRLIKLVETGIENSGEYPEGGEADMYISMREYHGNTFLKAKDGIP